MKKQLLLLASSLLLAAATVASAFDENPAPSTTTDLDLLERLFAPANVARGMTPQDVRASLGAPNTTLAPHIWVYWNFKAKDTPRAENADTLLVIFAENRVQRIRLCDSKPVRTFLAQQEVKAAKAAKTAVAAK